MDIFMRSGDGTRIISTTGHSDVFIDINNVSSYCLAVDLYRFMNHVLKSKDGNCKMFTFANKEDMDNFDYGYWEDAETVWESCQ